MTEPHAGGDGVHLWNYLKVMPHDDDALHGKYIHYCLSAMSHCKDTLDLLTVNIVISTGFGLSLFLILMNLS